MVVTTQAPTCETRAISVPNGQPSRNRNRSWIALRKSPQATEQSARTYQPFRRAYALYSFVDRDTAGF